MSGEHSALRALGRFRVTELLAGVEFGVGVAY